MTEDETKLCQYLSKKYEPQINAFTFWSEDIIPRFVTDTYYITKYDERLKLTTSRFEQYLKFHRKFRFDDILTAPSMNDESRKRIIAEDTRLLPCYFYGIDHEAHPILWWKVTMLKDVKGINAAFSDFDDWERASFQLSRTQRMVTNLWSNINRHYGCTVNTCFAVIDLNGGSVPDFYGNRGFIQWYVRSGSELFPETLYKVFIINAPWAFQMIWKVICKFLDEITVQKTAILGGDYLKEMVKFIDLEMIPKEFGGKGIWDPRPGNVPVDFPFQMIGDQGDKKGKEMMDDEKSMENQDESNQAKMAQDEE